MKVGPIGFGVVWLLVLVVATMAHAGEITVLEACPGGTGYGQALSSAQASPGFSDDGDGLRAYDNFSGQPAPITGISWWGGGGNPQSCVRNPNNFEISFYKNNGGQPGDLVTTREVTSLGTVDNGLIGPLGSIVRYETTFEEPVNLASGWVSVFAVDFNGCYFYWANGVDGDQNAYNSGIGSLVADFAFCLISADEPFGTMVCPENAGYGQPAAPATGTPGYSGDGDNLRTYDGYSGLTTRITGVTWWGGGTAGGECNLAPNFNISFYENNGGQPGNLVSSEDVVAEAVSTGTQNSFGTLVQYHEDLAAPLVAPAGMVSVYGLSFQGCYFYWANGLDGNGSAYNSGFGSVAADYAFCLETENEYHTADRNSDNKFSLAELIRVIQFFNAGAFGCDDSSEDGYTLKVDIQDCATHASDYAPQDWSIQLSELLRLVQLFNSGGYTYCAIDDPFSEDLYCAD